MRPMQRSTASTAEDSTLTRKIGSFAWILITCWTVFIAVSWYWDYRAEQKVFHRVALTEARAVIERDALYRRWILTHGDVYVPATEQFPPNPYLSHLPDRDIVTPAGKHLTLINPSYMTRQVNDLAKNSNVLLGIARLTSLKPLRSENTPDPWEEKALRSFETGATEVSDVSMIDGKPFMRLIRPFVTEKPCLKCHISQGYTVGSIRGGISTSIPIQPLIDAGHDRIIGSAVFHIITWLLGLGVAGTGARMLYRSAREQQRTEHQLQLQTIRLEEEISERRRAQDSLQTRESHLRVVADYSSNWEFWRIEDDSFLYMSPSVYALTGYHIEEFSANRELVYSIMHQEDRDLFRNHTHNIDSHGQIMPIEFRIVCKDGTVRWVSHVCQQVFTPEGLPWGWRASNQDITERKQIEHELFEQTEALEEEVAEREAAQAELTELNRSLEERVRQTVADLRNKDQSLIQQGRLAAMGEMINNIAHQWRQPLNNLGLIIQNLQISYDVGSITQAEMDQEIGKAMDVILHMSSTIDDFRNFFREDKEKTVFSVGRTVQRTLDFISAALASHNIQIDFDDDDSVTVTGHQNEYTQVLLNIISNARETCIERHIPEPRISIRVTSENSRSVVSIRDNCGGIADDIMPRIFDPYFTTRAPDKGTGIGLYMSKVIIEQNMSGCLTASNRDGGVEFRIEV